MSANARHTSMQHGIEILEARIAPASVVVYPTIKDAELAYDKSPTTDTHFVTTKVGTPILLKAGQVLTTGVRARDGTYLMFVEKGEAMIFTTDFNNNNQVDFNEITGIAAGNGLRLISFVDINGDIVTNLDADGTLSDSNNNAVGDDPFLRGDGRVLDNSRIEKIELRSLTPADITDQDPGNDAIDGGLVDDSDVFQRLAFSSYSIHGNVFAGAGVGLASDPTSGIIIDSTGKALQSTYNGLGNSNFFYDFTPSIGAVKVGTAASDEYFSFGVSKADDIQGNLRPFVPIAGQAGADINYVHSADPSTMLFSISQLIAGDGGAGAPGGSITNITLHGDVNGGYIIKAGDGGRGNNGGVGGSILNFADLGTVTSQVTLQSGNGGDGTTGSGGAGGLVILAGAVTSTVNGVTTTTASFSVNGGVSVLLGDGGDGFRAGGAGASIGKGVITAPDTPASYGRQMVGMTHDGPHDPLTGKLIAGGNIGRTQAVDFDGDGFGDFVFSSSDSEQLIVQFGNGDGTFRLKADGVTPDRIYLDAPIAAEAITVGDFNGDGHQDIAAASQSDGNFGGIYVYLAKWEDGNVNGLTADEDANHNGVNDFQGFLTPRVSELPALQSGDPDAGLIYNSSFFFLNSGHAINDIEAGDFNGDGFTDLAISVTYTEKPPITVKDQVIIYMTPDVEDGRPTGQFFADFGAKRIAQPPQGANPLLPFFPLSHGTFAQIEATSLSTSAPHDDLLALPQGAKGFLILDNSVPSIGGPVGISGIATAGVDTDRLLTDLGNHHVAFVGGNAVTFKEIVVTDFNEDGKADFVALTLAPAAFIIAWTGDGQGGAKEFTVNAADPQQNAGIFLGVAQGGAYGLGGNFEAIRLGDGDGDGKLDEVAILNYLGNPMWRVPLVGFQATASSVISLQPGGVFDGIGGVSLFAAAPDESIVAFDSFVPVTANPATINFLVADPDKTVDTLAGLHNIESSGDLLFDISPISERYFHFVAGDGGDALIGRGGAGGSIGGGSISAVVDPTGLQNLLATSQFTITMPANIEFNGDVLFQAGSGGDGFTTGGNGGGLQALIVRFPNVLHSTVSLVAGNGGLGVASAGGNGGNIVGVSVENGEVYTAGTGGDGRTGGNGGSIIGNGIKNLFDTRDLYFTGLAGNGGNGVRHGGNGGSVLNFSTAFDLFLNDGGVGGELVLQGGIGGSAVSGPGGNGGSISKVSPLDQDNLFGGDILFTGGNGGNGTTGGSGGSVSGFTNGPDSDELPKVLSLIAGNGGNGTSGPGGVGGSISNIIAPMKGVLHTDPILGPPATLFDFNRILAGTGGSSAASAGGAGGSVSNINSKSEGGPFAVVAGAGGDGLIRGGDGGNTSGILIDIGATSVAKLLVVAGNGGDAGAFVANAGDGSFQNQAFKAFGGRVGRGGNGGSILGVTQLGGIASHVDLVAGNGGDTVFFGTVADSLSFVGVGGSVRNITADGTLGNILPSIAIVSYFDYRVGDSMTDFVAKNLRDEQNPGTILDNVGNVGVVVGAAGRLKRVFAGNDPAHEQNFVSTPAPKSVNGDLTNVHARGIMAAVAGNVDRIASITNVRDVSVIPGFVIGTPKDDGSVNHYLDKLGNPSTSPTLDGILLDGALVSAKQPLNAAGKPVTLPGNTFVIS